jgi:hypothetical protein
MIPLFRRMIFALLWDELAFVRWARGILLLVATAGLSIAAAPPGEAARWTAKEWAVRVGFGLAAAAAGMITAGEKNRAPPHAEPPAGGAP